MTEKLDIHIDGITYYVPRRRFKSGKMGFLLSAGQSVHGRMSWVQVIVRDTPELTYEQRMRRKIINRARKKIMRPKK